MAVLTRSLLPVVLPRRRPTHREPGHEATDGTRGTRPRPATPGRTLTLVALATVRRAGRADGRPVRWSSPPFAREVELVRLHLAPIRSRLGLASSFGREAFHADLAADPDQLGPVTAAYALRWLELGDGVRRPPWQAWLDEAAPARHGAGTRG